METTPKTLIDTKNLKKCRLNTLLGIKAGMEQAYEKTKEINLKEYIYILQELLYGRNGNRFMDITNDVLAKEIIEKYNFFKYELGTYEEWLNRK